MVLPSPARRECVKLSALGMQCTSKGASLMAPQWPETHSLYRPARETTHIALYVPSPLSPTWTVSLP